MTVTTIGEKRVGVLALGWDAGARLISSVPRVPAKRAAVDGMESWSAEDLRLPENVGGREGDADVVLGCIHSPILDDAAGLVTGKRGYRQQMYLTVWNCEDLVVFETSHVPCIVWVHTTMMSAIMNIYCSGKKFKFKFKFSAFNCKS